MSSRLDWEKANRRKQRGGSKLPHRKPRPNGPLLTAKQLGRLRELGRKTGCGFIMPTNSEQAKVEINRLERKLERESNPQTNKPNRTRTQ